MNKTDFDKLLDAYFSGDTAAANELGQYIRTRKISFEQIKFTLDLISIKQKIDVSVFATIASLFKKNTNNLCVSGLAWNLHGFFCEQGATTADAKPDYTTAIASYDCAIKLKNIYAVFNCVSMLRKGQGTEDGKPNYPKAIALLKQAYELKDTTAALYLAEMFLSGQGTKDSKPDYKEAIFYLRRAIILQKDAQKTCYRLLATIYVSDLFLEQNNPMTSEFNSVLTTRSHDRAHFQNNTSNQQSFLKTIQWGRRISVIEYKMVHTVIVKNGGTALKVITTLHNELLRAEFIFLSTPYNDNNRQIFTAACDVAMCNAIRIFHAYPDLSKFAAEIEHITTLSQPPRFITECRSTMFATLPPEPPNVCLKKSH